MRKIEKHNPNCKLIGGIFSVENKQVELVYAIENDLETNEGLEVFYKNSNYSRRFLPDQMPTKYQPYFDILKRQLPEVPDGHKLTVN